MKATTAETLLREIWTKDRLADRSEGVLPHGLCFLPGSDEVLPLMARRSDGNFEFRGIRLADLPTDASAVANRLNQEVLALIARAQKFHSPEPIGQ